MKKIALFTDYGWIGISSPLINTALYLNDFGYEVDIYIKENNFCNEMGLGKPNLNSCTNINFKYYKTDLETQNNLLTKSFEEIEEHILNQPKYELLIGFDPHGLVKAGLFGQLLNIKFIYFSLEIYDAKDMLKTLECFFSSKATLVITQDPQRMKVIADLNNVPLKKLAYVWNSSYDDNIIKEKKDYFREKFNISREKKIILAIGTLLPVNGIEYLLNSSKYFDEEFVVILHGWIPNTTFKSKIMKMVSERKNLFLSTEILSYEQKYTVFQSVDIGFIYFEPYDLNYKYAAGSAGKLFDFMKVGVPVIANNLPGMEELIEGNNIGYIFENDTDLNILLRKVMNEYTVLSENAHKTFFHYLFKKSFSNVMKEYI